jgi:hypothetical protein
MAIPGQDRCNKNNPAFVVPLTIEGTAAPTAFFTLQVDGDVHKAPAQFLLSAQKHLIT